MAPRRLPLSGPLHNQATSRALWLVLGVLLGVGGIVGGVSLALRHGLNVSGEATEPAEGAPKPPSPIPWTLTLATTPPGALASLDGEAIGETPLTYANLMGPIDRTLRIEAAGYAPYQEQLRLSAEGGTLRRNLILDPLPALVLLTLSPPVADAQVLVRAAVEGVVLLPLQPVSAQAPLLTLPAGDVWVEVSAPNHLPWSQRVQVVPGQRLDLTATLTPLPATVHLEPAHPDLRARLRAVEEGGVSTDIKAGEAPRQCDLPCTFADLLPGEYLLDVTDTTGARAPSSTRLRLAPGATVTLPVRLLNPATVAASSRRAGVRLSAQGGAFQRAGRASTSAAFGDAGGVLELATPSGLQATIRLEPAPSDSTHRFLLSVRCRPWARFEVNGAPHDSLHYFKLPPGDHTVRILPEGKKPPSPISFKLSISAPR